MEELMFIPDRYNVVGEVASLMFACLIWFLIEKTNPRRNRIFSLLHIAIVLSAVSIVVHIGIGWMAADINSPRGMILAMMSFYMIMNYMIVTLIATYLYELSINRRDHRAERGFFIAFFGVYALGALGYGLAVGFLQEARGYYDILPFERFHISLGIFWCVVSLVVLILSRKNIPPFVSKAMCSFILLDILVLILGWIYLPHLFTGVTYAGVIGLVYLLFHSNTYNEVTGAQGYEAMETRIYRDFRTHRDAMIVIIQVSFIRNLYRLEEKDPNYHRIIRCFRELERVDRKMQMFNLGADQLGVIIPLGEHGSQDSFQTVTNIRNIIRKYAVNEDNKDIYRILCVEEKALDYNIREINRMVEYLMNVKVVNPDESICYISVLQDYEDYADYRRIVKALKSIHRDKNLDDPRVLCYAQPIIDVKSGRYRTAESLMRLQLDGEIIYPDRFIEAAEREGVIHTLTCIMLNKVCKMIRELDREGVEYDAISINCSSLEFSNRQLYKRLLEIIRDNEVDPKRIRLELTESAIFKQKENVRRNMDKLMNEGIYFYLDDFGTGYSNLSRLLTYPFHTVKFDKSLLYKGLEDEEMGNLLQTMVEVFHDKGFEALIEGVEDQAQSDYVREKGFDHIQGYHYAKPRPIEELRNFFTGNE